MLGRALGAMAGQRQAARPASPDAPRSVLDSAYGDAMRHSRRVRLLRKAIPMACLAAVAGPIVWGVISPFARTIADVKMGAISVSGSKITMESPKLSGFKKDNKAYEVTADQAIQDIKVPSVVELNRLTARLEQDEKKFVRLTSDWGKFDQGADKLDLKGNVRVRTDNGQEADLLSAVVNVKSGDVTTTEPVTVRAPSGTISADRMQLRDNGKHAIFEGRVRSILIPSEEPDAASDSRTKTE
jgi:lipopolysaccharide export system protein LptC